MNGQNSMSDLSAAYSVLRATGEQLAAAEKALKAAEAKLAAIDAIVTKPWDGTAASAVVAIARILHPEEGQ